MNVIVEDLAKKCIDNIFYYNMQYSLKNAIETDENISKYIYSLENSPYLGRYISEISDKRFRELIYRKK